MTPEEKNGHRLAAWYDQLEPDDRAEADYVAGMTHTFAVQYLAVQTHSARGELKRIDDRTQRIEAKLDVQIEERAKPALSYTSFMGPLSALTVVGYVVAKLLGVPL